MLALVPVRHLDISTCYSTPWEGVILTDLSFCSCLETLKFANVDICKRRISNALPDIFLHDVTTLKNVELLGWYTMEKCTLPPGCLLRLVLVLDDPLNWHQWQLNGCPTSMLYLACMQLEAWPAGLQEMSGLQYLELLCGAMQDQDLAALQHIPHVSLGVEEFSTFLLTSGSWQSLQIWGNAGYFVDFSNVDAVVRGTERFSFGCSSQEATGMYRDLRAACTRQGVACHVCEHPDGIGVARLSNVKLCRAPATRSGAADGGHEHLVCMKELWPSRAAYPQLYPLNFLTT